MLCDMVPLWSPATSVPVAAMVCMTGCPSSLVSALEFLLLVSRRRMLAAHCSDRSLVLLCSAIWADTLAGWPCSMRSRLVL
ncbi:hypothetical protein FQZ97_1029470 [compost metagenome]